MRKFGQKNSAVSVSACTCGMLAVRYPQNHLSSRSRPDEVRSGVAIPFITPVCVISRPSERTGAAICFTPEEPEQPCQGFSTGGTEPKRIRETIRRTLTRLPGLKNLISPSNLSNRHVPTLMEPYYLITGGKQIWQGIRSTFGVCGVTKVGKHE